MVKNNELRMVIWNSTSQFINPPILTTFVDLVRKICLNPLWFKRTMVEYFQTGLINKKESYLWNFLEIPYVVI